MDFLLPTVFILIFIPVSPTRLRSLLSVTSSGTEAALRQKARKILWIIKPQTLADQLIGVVLARMLCSMSKLYHSCGEPIQGSEGRFRGLPGTGGMVLASATHAYAMTLFLHSIDPLKHIVSNTISDTAVFLTDWKTG